MTFKGETQYRTKALSGICTQIFWGLMYIYLYTAFMGGKVIEGFSISQMVTYIWLGQAFFSMRYILLPNRCATDITNGNVCYKFIRPVDIYNQWFFEHFGQRLSATILRFLPIIVISFLLPTNISLSLPVSLTAFVLFIIALTIGSLLSVAFSMIAIYITFKTLSPKGAVTIVNSITTLLGGMIIPLPLMPMALQNVLVWLPFRYITDLPFRIYIGNIGTIDALIQIGISFAWLVLLIVLGKLLMKKALKNTIIQGG